jgi:5-methylcytosine-specific restriction endonuclease McrA
MHKDQTMPSTLPSGPARQPERFEMARRMVRVSDETLTQAVRRFAALRDGRPFTMKQFEQWPERPCHAQALTHRFGTWRDVLRLAGAPGGRPREWSNEELLDQLSQLWMTLGRRPGASELRKHGKPCATAYDKRWGSVVRACEALARYHRAEISWEEAVRGTPRQRRRGLSARLRWRVLTRDGHRCVSCGACPYEDRAVKLHIDHILPVSRGGGDEESNLRVLCRACNQGKAAGVPGQAA